MIIFAASIDETMSIKELQEVYAKHPNVAGLASLRKNKDIKTVYLEGMHGSCASLFASVSVQDDAGNSCVYTERFGGSRVFLP